MQDEVLTAADFARTHVDHKPLIVLVVIMLVTHVIVLKRLPWHRSSPEVAPAISVTIKRLGKRLESSEGSRTARALPTDIKVPSPVAFSEEKNAERDAASVPAPLYFLDMNEVRDQVKASAMQQAREQQAAIPTDPGRPRLVKLFRERVPVSQTTAAHGGSMYLATSSRGKQRCMQQRGDPFNSSTWMWYRVPLEMCGHLRN